jgi:hypothetical protein
LIGRSTTTAGGSVLVCKRGIFDIARADGVGSRGEINLPGPGTAGFTAVPLDKGELAFSSNEVSWELNLSNVSFGLCWQGMRLKEGVFQKIGIKNVRNLIVLT